MSSKESLFPLQPARRDYPRAAAPLSIPWSVAEKAYAVYASRYGRGQSLKHLAERGGFGVSEMDDLYPPWRDEVSEIAALRAALEETTADRDRLRTANAALAEALKDVYENVKDTDCGFVDLEHGFMVAAREVLARHAPSPDEEKP